MIDPVPVVVAAAYLSLVVELVAFPIPSEASTFQLFFRSPKGASEARLVRARSRPGGVKLVFYFLPTALGVALFLVAPIAAVFPGLIDHLLPIRTLESPFVTAAGAALVIAGRMTTFTSVLQLRRKKRDHALQDSALFVHSRNPGLVGMYAFYLGNCLLFPCVLLFAGFVPYVVNMHHRVLMEEDHLSASLGDEYREYLRRVPRYVRLRRTGAAR